jgi:protoheme IX farnesyltransferase
LSKKEIVAVAQQPVLKAKFTDYVQLTKLRLSFSVVFSASAGYLLGVDSVSASVLVSLIIGGFLVVGASNGFNQIIERNRDALMDRTRNRPIPAGRMTVLEAMIASTTMLIAGLGLLYTIKNKSSCFEARRIFNDTVLY